jgi:hypothetical protein
MRILMHWTAFSLVTSRDVAMLLQRLPRVVILRLEGRPPIRPDCDSMTHGKGLPLAFVQLRRRV